MNENIEKTNQTIMSLMGIIMLMLVFGGLYFVPKMYAFFGHALHPTETEMFYVATPAGEAFKVSATHKCGPHLRTGAIRATQGQTGVMESSQHELILEALTSDWARIYNRNTVDRCMIKDLKFTNITHRYEDER